MLRLFLLHCLYVLLIVSLRVLAFAAGDVSVLVAGTEHYPQPSAVIDGALKGTRVLAWL